MILNTKFITEDKDFCVFFGESYKIFNSIEEAEDYTRTMSFQESLLFEKYSINSINSKQLHESFLYKTQK